MTHIYCPECESASWKIDELVPGDLTLFCSECSHKQPLSEEWQVYRDFTAEEVRR